MSDAQPTRPRPDSTRRDGERGSALVVAVLVSVIMALLGISFLLSCNEPFYRATPPPGAAGRITTRCAASRGEVDTFSTSRRESQRQVPRPASSTSKPSGW